MAAILKKRALAEYSQAQSQTIVQEPVPKKLRLIKQRQPSGVADPSKREQSITLENEINSLDTAGHSVADTFKLLSKIASALPASQKIESLLWKKLISLYHSNSDAAIRSKCLSVLQLLKLGPADVTLMLDEVIRLTSKETRPIVLLTGLTVALKLANTVSNPFLNSRLVALAKKFIRNTDSRVKCKCLELLGSLLNYDDPSVVTDTVQFVHSYSHSHDPRVRSMSFKILLQLHKKGAPLELSTYKDVVKYLDDDYEIVKLAAIELFWTLSQTYPEELIPAPDGGEKMRLIDDAFGKICKTINDPCVQVRVLAAHLLGKMPQVGQAFLDQTLDKKLMSDMRRKRSAHERQREKVRAGEWSSGKGWADDAPKELIDADSVSLISSGAAGAFVHGLEDEYQEVRSAAVDSLCTLSMRRPDFATLALDFLVDMFNDEIEEVRLKAIDSLTKISRHIVLWEDQLEVILSAIEDTAIDIREGLHKLLSVCTLMTKNCIKICLENLLANLRKYPHDKKSIWKCLEGVGRNHPWLVLPLVPNLLSQHPFFDTPETDPEDPAYASVLILVLNGAKGCPTMKTLFDEKLIRHYHYLRDTIPQYIPDLSDVLTEAGHASSFATVTIPTIGDETKPGSSNGRILLKELIGKLKNSDDLSPVMKLQLHKLILKDLKRLAEVDQEISVMAKFTSLYVRAQLIYTNCIHSSGLLKLSSESRNQTQNNMTKTQIDSLLQLCLKMQYGFSGLSSTEYAVIIQLKLRVLALQLAYIAHGSSGSALAPCQNLLEQAEVVQKYLESNGNIKPDDFTQALFLLLDSTNDPKPGTLSSKFLPYFENHPIKLVSFTSQLKMARATIIEPTGDSDTPLKFTAGLLLGIPFDCELKDVTDTSSIRIRVKYPDQQVHLIRPRSSDFRAISSDETRLLTVINVSHNAWTEPCPISISVVLHVSEPETHLNRKLVGKNDPTYTLDLSDEKQVLVSPKAPKRNLL